jgi:hypothetical protein
MKFVGRFSGIVAYSDDTHQQFAAHLDERGHISVNCATESNQAILEVQTGHSWLETMLALVSGTLALSPTGSSTKTVNGATLHFSGRVARNNDTWEDFAVQYDVKAGGAFVLDSSGNGPATGLNDDVAAYDEFVTATLDTWFETLVGAGNATTP